MATRWEERVRAAELARFEATPFGRLITALGIPARWLRPARLAKQAVLVFAWTLVPWRLKLFAFGFAAAGLLVVLGGITVLAVTIGHLA